MDGIAHGLGRATQAAGDLPRAVSGRAGQENLGAAERESARRPQARLELSPFRIAQLTNKDRWMHPNQMLFSSPSHKSSLEPALGCGGMMLDASGNALQITPTARCLLERETGPARSDSLDWVR